MKKLFSLLALTTVILSAVSCDSEKENPKIKQNEPVYNSEGKPVITIGTFGYVDPYFTDYLNNPTDMEIKIVDYSEGIEDNSQKYENELYNEFDQALITGNAPDILFLPPENMYHLNKQGVLTDFYSLMDNYDYYKREDFLPCVLEGLTIDGEIPALMDSYFICTAMAKTKYIPKEYENWTSADAIKFYEEYNSKINFYDCSTEMSLVEYMLNLQGLHSIDMLNATCDFNGAFENLLDFCIKNPVEVIPVKDFSLMDDLDKEEYTNEEWTKGLNDGQLIYPLRIDGFNSGLGYQTYAYLNEEDITFVGYPTENGDGAYVMANHQQMFAICEQSGNKELAWDVLCHMLKYQKPLEKNANDGSRGVPVLVSQLQADYDRPADYSNSINNGNMALYNSIDNEPVYLPQEYKDMLYNYVLSVPANPYKFNYELKGMIDEEIESAIKDHISAKDTVDRLNGRLETYLSEKN